jgi:hypothetical protein
MMLHLETSDWCCYCDLVHENIYEFYVEQVNSNEI